MRRPSRAGVRSAAARHRPALVLSTGAVLIALAGGATGAVLAGGHDDHGWSDRGPHVELDGGLGSSAPGHH